MTTFSSDTEIVTEIYQVASGLYKVNVILQEFTEVHLCGTQLNLEGKK